MNKTATRIITVLLIAVLLIAGIQLWRHQSAEKEIDDPPVEPTGQLQPPTPTASAEPTVSGEPMQTAPPSLTVYEQYGDWFMQNGDMVGWIKIDGTIIDSPVMQTPDRSDFYLTHGFDKQPGDTGVPYVIAGCIDPQSGNIIIVLSGAMYETLQSYENATFRQEHAIIRFDTFVGFGEYEIIAVSKSDSGITADDGDKLLTLNVGGQLTIVAKKIII